MDLQGRVVVVTGASRGIGRCVVELLGSRGTSLVCVARDEAATAEVAASVGGLPLALDLTADGSPGEVVRRTLDAHGRIDAVVANAGRGYAGPAAEMSDDLIRELIAVDTTATLLLARAALGPLASTGTLSAGARRGSLVFVTSIVGLVSVPGEAVYSAAKAAVESFATAAREEVMPAVSVSTVAPGPVDTDFFRTRGAAYDRRFPRKVSPERVAAAVVRAIETGAPRTVVPRWLDAPARFSGLAPRTYRWLERHFG